MVKQALELLRGPIDEARQALAQMVPKVSELAAQLAKETETLKKETEEQADKTAVDKQAGRARRRPRRKSSREQAALNAKVDTFKDLIRAEANKQDVFEKGGREVARDADDALAMLKEPPPKAEQALKDAAQVAQPDLHEQASVKLRRSRRSSRKRCNQIAQHFQNVEQGKAGGDPAGAARDRGAERDQGGNGRAVCQSRGARADGAAVAG